MASSDIKVIQETLRRSRLYSCVYKNERDDSMCFLCSKLIESETSCVTISTKDGMSTLTRKNLLSLNRNSHLTNPITAALNSVFAHTDCFKCNLCLEALVDFQAYVNPENFGKPIKLFCLRHFLELFKPRCAFCDKLIMEEQCTEAEDKVWHIPCFSCFQCKKPLGGQQYVMSKPVNINSNELQVIKPSCEYPFCLACYNALFAELCEECGEMISVGDDSIKHESRHWHANSVCFKCNYCAKPLLGGPFLPASDGKVYCSGDCFQNMLKIYTAKSSPSIRNSPNSVSTYGSRPSPPPPPCSLGPPPSDKQMLMLPNSDHPSGQSSGEYVSVSQQSILQYLKEQICREKIMITEVSSSREDSDNRSGQNDATSSSSLSSPSSSPTEPHLKSCSPSSLNNSHGITEDQVKKVGFKPHSSSSSESTPLLIRTSLVYDKPDVIQSYKNIEQPKTSKQNSHPKDPPKEESPKKALPSNLSSHQDGKKDDKKSQQSLCEDAKKAETVPKTSSPSGSVTSFTEIDTKANSNVKSVTFDPSVKENERTRRVRPHRRSQREDDRCSTCSSSTCSSSSSSSSSEDEFDYDPRCQTRNVQRVSGARIHYVSRTVSGGTLKRNNAQNARTPRKSANEACLIS